MREVIGEDCIETVRLAAIKGDVIAKAILEHLRGLSDPPDVDRN